MRIGIVAPPWIPVPPPAYGGIEAVVDVLARGLANLGHEVILAAGRGSTCPVTRVPLTEAAEPGSIGDMQSERRHVALAYAALRDVDIVHDHTLSGPVFPNRPNGVPVVTTVHGPFVPEMRRLYQSVPSDVAIIAISKNQASTAGAVRISGVIYHGIDASAIRVGTGSGGYLAFLGRMIPAKGVRQAITVARRAGVPLRIAAKMREPAEQDYFTRTIEPLLGPDVEYLGELTWLEKYELLGSAVALLNPIQWPEPFGMVMIEAMAVGTPVIATPRGAAPEIVDDGVTGYLRSTISGLVSAVDKASGLDRRAIRLRLEQRFSMERMARNHAEFYARVVAGRSSGHRADDTPLTYQAAGL